MHESPNLATRKPNKSFISLLSHNNSTMNLPFNFLCNTYKTQQCLKSINKFAKDYFEYFRVNCIISSALCNTFNTKEEKHSP